MVGTRWLNKKLDKCVNELTHAVARSRGSDAETDVRGRTPESRGTLTELSKLRHSGQQVVGGGGGLATNGYADNLHGYVGGVLQQFQTLGSGMPPSGSGGQHTPGAGEQGIGAGAPQGGLCGPQHGQSLHGPPHPPRHGPQPPPQGPHPPQGPQPPPHGPHPQPPPPQQPPQDRDRPPPPAQVAAVAAHRIRLLFTPIVMFANLSGNDAGPHDGNGKHMQPGLPWHAARGHLSCRPLRLMQSQLV